MNARRLVLRGGGLLTVVVVLYLTAGCGGSTDAPWVGVWRGPAAPDGSGAGQWVFAEDGSFSMVAPARRVAVDGSWSSRDDHRVLELDLVPAPRDPVPSGGEGDAAAAGAVVWPRGGQRWQVELDDATLRLRRDGVQLVLRR